MGNPVINVVDLVKKYGNLTALDHLSFMVAEGEILGLLGPNGSGKTTAINCILSLLKFEKGSIEVFGRQMSPDAYDIKRDIGVVMQNVAVFNELTVYENIDYFCGLYVHDKAVRKPYVEEAITFTGLKDFRKFYPKKLSGGLLRRLNIACGIAHKPKLIIMDEPTVAVDPQSRNNILEGIKRLNKNGATVLYTSHYMEEVELICSRIIILDKGKIIASGTKQELKAMIELGEKIRVEGVSLDDVLMEKIKNRPGILVADYRDRALEVRFAREGNGVLGLLNFLRDNGIEMGRLYSEMPTLNDVFLELTGKELRD
ncbi:MAG: ABC transporter ATP-binding protein [Eubacteriales bacterium]|nr:ABC transporter ATP-binding protein [Eubacteriales bacterium]